MRTRDKISIAALAASGATLVAVIVAPAPGAPAKGSGFSSERVLLKSSAEQRAVLKDRDDLRALDRRIEPLRVRFAGETKAPAGPAGPDVREVVRSEVERELARRWKEFRRRLNEIRK